MNPYNDTRDECVKTWGRAHANGEQTHVAVVTVGNDRYAAVAYDVDPADFSALEAACVAYDPTLEGVTTKAQRWMENHPKGVAPGGSQGKGRLAAAWEKFVAWCEKVVEQGQESKQGKQQLEGWEEQ